MVLQAALRASKALLMALGMDADWGNCVEVLHESAATILAVPQYINLAESLPTWDAPPPEWARQDEDF